MRPDDDGEPEPGESPSARANAPLLGTWRRWYTVVLGTLAALVALFEWLSVHYR